jgi:ribonuclease-3
LVITKKAIEWDYEKQKISKLLEILEIKYIDITYYILSFIHKSIVNERADYAPEDNERLEFLWDAVLELVVTDKLYSDFPEKAEGELTDIRSAIVRWKNLAKVARNLWFKDYLFLWKWEEKTGGRDNDYILANTVESFLWAIYKDLWYTEAKNFVLKNIYISLDEIFAKNLTKDYKTLFQEFAQAEYEVTPNYKLISHEWPDHNKNFEVWVFLWEKKIWIWNGSSKKKAQEVAAENAYNILFK